MSAVPGAMLCLPLAPGVSSGRTVTVTVKRTLVLHQEVYAGMRPYRWFVKHSRTSKGVLKKRDILRTGLLWLAPAYSYSLPYTTALVAYMSPI